MGAGSLNSNISFNREAYYETKQKNYEQWIKR